MVDGEFDSSLRVSKVSERSEAERGSFQPTFIKVRQPKYTPSQEMLKQRSQSARVSLTKLPPPPMPAWQIKTLSWSTRTHDSSEF